MSTKGESKSSGIWMYMLVYPFLLRGLYKVVMSFDSLYMNPTCLMDFVRQSSGDHYELHPLWKYYQKNMTENETCEALMGMPIMQVFEKVYYFGVTEFYLFYAIGFLYAGLSMLRFLKNLFTGKINVLCIIPSAIVAFNVGSIFHLLAHYQNDLTHLNGNVMHHSSFSIGGDNASLVNTLPPGLIINFPVNYFTIWWMTYMVLDYFKLDKWAYFDFAAPFTLFKFVMQMKIIHPFVHTQHRSWYAEYISKHILYFMDDYKGHVLCHHKNGYCLGDSPLYGWIYDYMLYYHGKLYENGIVTYGFPSHEVCTIVIDYCLLILAFVSLFLTIGFFSPIMQGQKDSIAKGKKAN